MKRRPYAKMTQCKDDILLRRLAAKITIKKITLCKDDFTQRLPSNDNLKLRMF